MKVLIFGIGPIASWIKNNLPNCASVFFAVTDSRFLNSNDTIYSNVDVIANMNVNDFDEAYIGIGYKNLELRLELYHKYHRLIQFPNLISSKLPSAVRMGEANIIMTNVIVEDRVEIGNANILWQGSHLCHDANIKNSCFFAAGSKVGGFSTVENYCKLGFNSVLCDGSTLPVSTSIQALNFYK